MTGFDVLHLAIPKSLASFKCLRVSFCPVG
uniref:Uncharacterized protein n=1 Tax=Anguilla anguilla TaxID=7936 RepID=A0A0E9S2K2_ANGAN